VNSVIKCWSEGVPMMKVGGKARLVCPPELGYGSRTTGAIPSDATLVFDIELQEIVSHGGTGSEK
jgi:FKBP-type peptidyl-prolyl cis-trans isomerase FkpA